MSNPAALGELSLHIRTLHLYRGYLRAIKQLKYSDRNYVHSRVKQEFQRLGQIPTDEDTLGKHLKDGERLLANNLGGLL
ncbi:hypothetical protein BJ085DRAFT_41185 [Dimargaris cristalligena]|uniref:Complex 1 LYR protein domain-containing protein n=1 Tax=Dimargaris cristalligena TaxID=215637 RepID=A0A4P9ZP23_9FUNG|nr:hypothetical protein BJ085DRAFT_41185 [Dimargaris cristalligena]|eukprot:RKP35063.1 hypothetical protein BJ085DRAFT_41185 [Dimargaris cristalligena]